MSKFEYGKKYMMRAIGDNNCAWVYLCTRVTESSVWLQLDGCGDVKRYKLHTSYDGSLYALPLGGGSMSPCLRPENKI